MLNQVEKTVYISGRHTEEYSIAMNEKQKYRVNIALIYSEKCFILHIFIGWFKLHMLPR